MKDLIFCTSKYGLEPEADICDPFYCNSDGQISNLRFCATRNIQDTTNDFVIKRKLILY